MNTNITDVDFRSVHPRLNIRFLNNLFLWYEVVSLTPNPNLGDQGITLRLTPSP
jgi:hypothetical protein